MIGKCKKIAKMPHYIFKGRVRSLLLSFLLFPPTPKLLPKPFWGGGVIEHASSSSGSLFVMFL